MVSQGAEIIRGNRVFVGLSGGVDSSVAAALLKRDYYDVTGVFIKIWSPEWLWCTSKEDRLDAMRVCAKLDIPFREIDMTQEYKREVVDYMVREYKAGRTPNPDVMCNQKIKFGKFFEWAIGQGADYVATGHYAQVITHEACNIKHKMEKRTKAKWARPGDTCYKLHVSSDCEKDQTYFLWTLTQRELARTLFPIGHLTKPQVRKLARKFGLPTADKKDSQGLCFVGPIDLKEFLSRYIKPKRGEVLDTKGNVIGWHNGAEFVTVGERHGFTVNVNLTRKERGLNAEENKIPHYVVGKDVNRNTITVSPAPLKEKDFTVNTVTLSHVNWVDGRVPPDGMRCLARFRYRGLLKKVHIQQKKLNHKVWFETPQTAVALGQSLVFYDGDMCLGGGVIKENNSCNMNHES